ncbi:hypothetical protein DdX_21802 [Ditylenchus destructor]|uniref:Uncharacterized protein n=1 Tax=Ditylenchus destructor TaxID=166010 RepID=A0AAD4QSV0_9BILA|nr:hypothetical protein DdX_21802 [Ditylenchus destructor]
MNIILCVIAASILVNVVLSATPKQKLNSVQEKLQGVKTTLDALKNQSTSNQSTSSNNFQTTITWALGHVDELNDVVDALNSDYHIDVIKNARRLANELYHWIEKIGNYTHAASDPGKAKELQQSASSAVGEISIILNNLQDDLRKGKTLEQGNSEAEKNMPKEKLKHIQEKLQVVKTKLGNLKNESNFGDEVTMLETYQVYNGQKSFYDNIVNSLRHADQLSKAVDAALKVEEKEIDIKKLRSLARSLYKDTEKIGRYTEYAKDPEKAIKLLQSAFSAVGETLRDIEPDLSTPKQKMKSVQEKLQGVKTTLDALKNQSTSNQSTSSYNFQTAITWALGHVGELNTVVDALNSDYHIDVIKNARRLANELYHWIEKIGIYTHAASDPGKAKELQQSAFSAVGEISIILNNLQDDLR